MVPATAGALQILMILLPGFAAAYLVQMLALRNTQTDFDKVIEAGLYSFLIYISFLLCTGGLLPFDIQSRRRPRSRLRLSGIRSVWSA